MRLLAAVNEIASLLLCSSVCWCVDVQTEGSVPLSWPCVMSTCAAPAPCVCVLEEHTKFVRLHRIGTCIALDMFLSVLV